MIKAIIFDCFGVLVGSTYEPFKRKYFAHDQKLLEKFVELDQLSSEGKMDYDTLNKEFSKLVGLSPEEVLGELSANPRNAKLLDYISNNLKTKYKIGFLSNVATDRMDELFLAEDIELFNDIILSFEVGMAKPDPEIFILAAKRLGVEPEECVFVDDLEKYLTGASRVGMQSVLYKNVEDLKVELGKLGI